MIPINPVTNVVAGSAAAERAAAADKAQQLKRIERNRKNTPAGDQYERTIESPDELEPIADQHHKQQPRQQNQKKPPQPKLDIRV